MSSCRESIRKNLVTDDANDECSQKVEETPYLRNVGLVKGDYCILHPQYTSDSLEMNSRIFFIRVEGEEMQAEFPHICERFEAYECINIGQYKRDFWQQIFQGMAIKYGTILVTCMFLCSLILMLSFRIGSKKSEIRFMLYCRHDLKRVLLFLSGQAMLVVFAASCCSEMIFPKVFHYTRKGPEYTVYSGWNFLCILGILAVVFVLQYFALYGVERAFLRRNPIDGFNLEYEFPDYMNVEMVLKTPTLFQAGDSERYSVQLEELLELAELQGVRFNKAFAVSEEDRRMMHVVCCVMGRAKKIRLPLAQELFIDKNDIARYQNVVEWARVKGKEVIWESDV